MKLSGFVVVILIISCTQVFGQFTAQLSPAETVIAGRSQIIGYIGLYDDVLGLVGGIRRGVGGYSDIAFRAGFLDFDNRGNDVNGFVLNTDYRYQLMETRINDPLDLSVGGLFEFVRVSSSNTYSLGAFVVGSRSERLTDERALWPFGRIVLRWDKTESDSDINIGFTAGASIELNESTQISGELQFDDMFGFIIGIVF